MLTGTNYWHSWSASLVLALPPTFRPGLDLHEVRLVSPVSSLQRENSENCQPTTDQNTAWEAFTFNNNYMLALTLTMSPTFTDPRWT